MLVSLLAATTVLASDQGQLNGTALLDSLHGPLIIGYWGCSPGGHTSSKSQLESSISKGYNVIVYAFYDVDAHGSLIPDPGAVGAPHKKDINAGGKSFVYLVSLFGGQNGAAPTLTTSADQWATKMADNFKSLAAGKGFDGIDIDLENSWGGTGDQVACGLRIFFELIKKHGFVVSMAPQTTALTPEVATYATGSWNSYVPLADTSMMNYVDIVAVQLYNNPVPKNNVEAYATALLTGFSVTGCPKCSNISCHVKVPAKKIAFGYPAGEGAAPSGCPGLSGGCPYGAHLASLYKASSKLEATNGVMTWSVEWDQASHWQFVDNAKTIHFT